MSNWQISLSTVFCMEWTRVKILDEINLGSDTVREGVHTSDQAIELLFISADDRYIVKTRSSGRIKAGMGKRRSIVVLKCIET